MPALFISDLHLSAGRPRTAAAFFDFLSGPARQAGSLFILGDLFEYWAGDDDLDAPFNQRVCAALRAVAVGGAALFFMTGNRDLLAGEGFARAAGARLLADPTPIRLGMRAVLLSHGDALCTDDHAYQTFRRQVRDPDWQAGFLAQPLAVRRSYIEDARAQSEIAKNNKPAAIMDVNAEAVAALLRAHGYPTLIHGHTHRPARHTHYIDGHCCERIVLADWDERPLWLACAGAEFKMEG
ncbi:MAG: UDP-2,3-diacylglucosamine diphosphatase [Azoarcus sp.]|nr:UDP-2,3-diacylglucosamine diphosphatase [Azoarcus sp.]